VRDRVIECVWENKIRRIYYTHRRMPEILKCMAGFVRRCSGLLWMWQSRVKGGVDAVRSRLSGLASWKFQCHEEHMSRVNSSASVGAAPLFSSNAVRCFKSCKRPLGRNHQQELDRIDKTLLY
jgi:hypothetical protein